MATAAPQLPRRLLGTTGLEVAVLSFGASPLGGIYEGIQEKACIEAVHEAFRYGINFFDTSPYYGDTRSETLLGKALKNLPREELVIATKVGRYGVEPKDFDFSAEKIEASVAQSLQRLQVTYLDIVQCHDIEFGDLRQIVESSLPALHRLKRQGLVRFVGITGLPLDKFRYVLDRVPEGYVDVCLSYCHFCLNDTSLSTILPYLKDKKVGVINASPLGMGLLTQHGPPSWHPAPQEVKDACKKAADYCALHGVDISTIALSFTLAHADVSTTLVGMTTPDTVRANVQNACRSLKLGNDKGMTDTEAEVAEEVHKILACIKDVSWPSGIT